MKTGRIVGEDSAFQQRPQRGCRKGAADGALGRHRTTRVTGCTAKIHALLSSKPCGALSILEILLRAPSGGMVRP